MFKDFSFFNYMYDDNGELEIDAIKGLIGQCCSDAKMYYETKDYKYYNYSFKDGVSKLLIKLKKKDDKLEYEDCQTYFNHGETIKSKISSINDDGSCTMLVGTKGLIPVQMDHLDFEECDEVNAFYSFFPSKIGIMDDKEDYFNNMHRKTGNINIFNWNIGEVVPVVAMIKGDKEHYPLVDEEKLNNLSDNFMIGSGNIIDYKAIQTIIEIDQVPNISDGELPVGAFHYFKFETKLGEMSALVDNDIMKISLEAQKKENPKIDSDSIIKVYGIMAGVIDIKK